MRHTLLAWAAASALLLTACDGDTADDGATEDAVSPTTLAPVPDDEGATAPVDADTDTTTDAAPATQTPGEGEVMGGEEGQAAADRAKEFLMALVTADAGACELLLSFSDPEQPMTAIPSDLELCQTQLPATMEATVEAQGLGEDGIAVLESMQIRGAAVDGDTAVVGRDNYSPLFAEAMGDSTITLQRIDGEWYVDLDAYLATE